MSRKLKLSEEDEQSAWHHYSGNCFSCPRCSIWTNVMQEVDGAIEAYVKYMKEECGVEVHTRWVEVDD